MKKSARYLWLLIIAQALVLLAIQGTWIFQPRGSTEAKKKKAYSDIYGGLKTILQMFKDDCGRYPTTAEGLKLLTAPPQEGSLTNWRGPYLDSPEFLKDSWGHEYVYRLPAVYSTNGYDLFSLGPDGRSKTGGNDPDDISNWEKPAPPPAATLEYRETLFDRAPLFLLLVPFLYGVRLIAGIFSSRVRVLMSENPRVDIVWRLMSLAAVLWLLTLPRLAGR